MKRRFICRYCRKTEICPEYKPKEILHLNGCDRFEPKEGLNLSDLGNNEQIIKDDDGCYTVYHIK